MEQWSGSKLGKESAKSVYYHPVVVFFYLYAKHIMRNAGLDKSQAGIKIAGRIINSLRYADDATLKAESEEELKSLLMKVREKSKKSGLKLYIQRTRS